MEYFAYRDVSLSLWSILFLLSTERIRFLRHKAVKVSQRVCLLFSWICSGAGMVASIDPLGFNNVVSPWVCQICADITNTSLESLVVLFVFSFKRVANCAMSPDRTVEIYTAVLLMFSISAVCSPVMFAVDFKIGLSVKLLLFSAVLLFSLAIATTDIIKIRAVLVQQLQIGSGYLPAVRAQLFRLQVFVCGIYSIGLASATVDIYTAQAFLASSPFNGQFAWTGGARSFAWEVRGAPAAIPRYEMIVCAVQLCAVGGTLLFFWRVKLVERECSLPMETSSADYSHLEEGRRRISGRGDSGSGAAAGLDHGREGISRGSIGRGSISRGSISSRSTAGLPTLEGDVGDGISTLDMPSSPRWWPWRRRASSSGYGLSEAYMCTSAEEPPKEPDAEDWLRQTL
jgi:hypothetical protein